jgi:hypothetical protein
MSILQAAGFTTLPLIGSFGAMLLGRQRNQDRELKVIFI